MTQEATGPLSPAEIDRLTELCRLARSAPEDVGSPQPLRDEYLSLLFRIPEHPISPRPEVLPTDDEIVRMRAILKAAAGAGEEAWRSDPDLIQYMAELAPGMRAAAAAGSLSDAERARKDALEARLHSQADEPPSIDAFAEWCDLAARDAANQDGAAEPDAEAETPLAALYAHFAALGFRSHGAILHPEVKDALMIGVFSRDEGEPLTLVTSGVSAQPMSPAPTAPAASMMEIAARIPFKRSYRARDGLNLNAVADHPAAAFLQGLGMYALMGASLWRGHTFANEPYRRIAWGSRAVGVALDESRWLPESDRAAVMSTGERIEFFTLIPVYAEEVDLAMQDREAFLQRLEAQGDSQLFRGDRPNACAPERSESGVLRLFRRPKRT